jgi:hypothetical protein
VALAIDGLREIVLTLVVIGGGVRLAVPGDGRVPTVDTPYGRTAKRDRAVPTPSHT